MCAERRRVSSGAPWEDTVGYCRAVRVGDLVEVSGTAPVGDDGEVVGEGDAYVQTCRCLGIAMRALEELGARVEDVVRTRMYVTDIGQWEAVGRAHGEFFARVKPATTMVEVRGLIDPRMLVEVEVTAVTGAEE